MVSKALIRAEGKLNYFAGPLGHFAAKFRAIGRRYAGGIDEIFEDEREAVTRRESFVHVFLHFRFECVDDFFVSLVDGHKLRKRESPVTRSSATRKVSRSFHDKGK
jgi:hypothetical protein